MAVVVAVLIVAATAGGERRGSFSPTTYARKRPCVQPLFETARIGGRARVWLRGKAKVGPEINPLWGGYRNLARGTDVWVIVYSLTTDRFYPQSHRTDRPAELFGHGRHRGRFRTAAYFGGVSGERYEVVTVLARRGASRSLSATLRSWARAGDFPGLSAAAMPVGLDRKDCAKVRLRL